MATHRETMARISRLADTLNEGPHPLRRGRKPWPQTGMGPKPAPVFVVGSAVLRPDGTGEIELHTYRDGRVMRYRFDLQGRPVGRTVQWVARYMADAWPLTAAPAAQPVAVAS